MDLEKIRKINELTKTLQKHNFATSSLEAVDSASHIYNESTQLQEEANPQPQIAVEQPIAENNTLLEKRYQMILEMNTKKFEQEIYSLKEQISTLSSQIMGLRAEMMRISSQTKPAEVKVESQNNQKEESNQETQTQSEKTENNNANNSNSEQKKEHPRQGAFTSQDVPIEKFFYFGRK